jgi:protein-S-isoprenylcysteine O-methyltransferase Ste14
LTLALFFVLTKKAEFEEIEIEKKFPSYKEYRDEVTGRLVPSIVTDNLASFMEKLGTKE